MENILLKISLENNNLIFKNSNEIIENLFNKNKDVFPSNFSEAVHFVVKEKVFLIGINFQDTI